MDSRKKKRLEAAGWRVATEVEFLGLTFAESALIDFKLALAELVRSTRLRSRLSQQALAKRLRSSQSRIAKLEAGEAGVSLDLMVMAAFAAGAKGKELAKAFSTKRRAAAG